MLESLLLFARYGQPVLITPFVMAGVTGPTTLAGTLAQHNAEVLAGIALTQLVRPGTPVLYGTATSNVDLRSGAPAIGSPESALSIAICSQLARYYGLPCRGGGALTDAPLPDGQSQYERMFTLLISLLSGINFLMHGVGILESYLTLSYEQFIIDLELLEMLRHLIQPVEVSPETLALETIHEVGPGGHFLEAAHTLRHYREAHFLPQLSQRQTYEQWLAGGSKDLRQRANERCQELLAGYAPPPMDPAIRAGLDEFIERRKRELL
jgi:trimethylamine--corrinoid protein Co-methyltransferase